MSDDTDRQHWLIASDAPISVIAAECGYQDLFSFSHRFHKVLGVSATVYRHHRANHHKD